MITIATEIPLKKNVSVSVNWTIAQDCPHPDMAAEYGRLAWRNFDGLLKQYGNPARGLGHSYSVCMDSKSEPFQFRNNDLGKIRANITITQWGSCTWSVRGNESPKDSEQVLLDTYVKPAIMKAIKEHEEELKADAIQRLKDHIVYQVNDTRKALEKLIDEMNKAIEAL